MCNLKKSYLLIVLFISQICMAQEGLAVYTDYLTDNYYLLHPSMAGAANCGKIRLTARQQWMGQKDAPALQTLSFNSKIGDQSGIGIIAFNDKNGYHSQMGGKLTYAHHIDLSDDYRELNRLSFGVSAGMVRTILDESKFTVFDPIITEGAKPQDSYFNADFGASYQYMDFYTHFTVKNAVSSKRDIYTDVESNNLRKYLLSAGYVFGTYSHSGFAWEPSVMLQFTEKTQEKSFDVNMKVYKEWGLGQVWGGVSYRRSIDGVKYDIENSNSKQYAQYITPIFGMNYKKFVVSYSYSYLTGPVRFDKGGFHQITIGFNLFCKESRYECNCPAVNY